MANLTPELRDNAPNPLRGLAKLAALIVVAAISFAFMPQDCIQYLETAAVRYYGEAKKAALDYIGDHGPAVSVRFNAEAKALGSDVAGAYENAKQQVSRAIGEQLQKEIGRIFGSDPGGK